ncbi:22066_t:CDS:2, partial [Gigaspora rosea]
APKVVLINRENIVKLLRVTERNENANIIEDDEADSPDADLN